MRKLSPPKKTGARKPREARRVAILVDTSGAWGHGIVTGINRFSLEQGGWQLFVASLHEPGAHALFARWKGDGVISRVAEVDVARHLRRKRLPVINVSSAQHPAIQFPRVANDVDAVAEMAVQHFHEKGFRNLGYLSLEGLEYVQRQRRAFVREAKSLGCICFVQEVRTGKKTQMIDWNLKLEELGAWLQGLPKPVGILVWQGGQELVHACLAKGIAIPEEVAVLIANDDELLCTCSPVPLSGVQVNAERIGFEAARSLAMLMDGKSLPDLQKSIPPLRVATRQSTETIAVTDPALRAGVKYIRQHLTEPFLVDDVAAHAGIARRSLENRFRSGLHCSPSVYIQMLRLNQARELLIDTDSSIESIAAQSGFTSPEYFATCFRSRFGKSPLSFRKTSRGRASFQV